MYIGNANSTYIVTYIHINFPSIAQYEFHGFSTIAQSFLYKKDSPFIGFSTIAQSFLYYCAIK